MHVSNTVCSQGCSKTRSKTTVNGGKTLIILASCARILDCSI